MFPHPRRVRKQISVARGEVISSNRGLRGSERINFIMLLHVVHDNSANRKCAQVGVGRGVESMVASRIGGYATPQTCRFYRPLLNLGHYSKFQN